MGNKTRAANRAHANKVYQQRIAQGVPLTDDIKRVLNESYNHETTRIHFGVSEGVVFALEYEPTIALVPVNFSDRRCFITNIAEADLQDCISGFYFFSIDTGWVRACDFPGKTVSEQEVRKQQARLIIGSHLYPNPQDKVGELIRQGLVTDPGHSLTSSAGAALLHGIMGNQEASASALEASDRYFFSVESTPEQRRAWVEDNLRSLCN